MAFDEQEHNIYVTGLVGCTSVIVVSRLGAWASHFWETPSFSFTGENDRFQADVLDYLTNNLQPHSATFSDSSTTKIYIMTTAPQENNLYAAGDPSNGNNPQECESKFHRENNTSQNLTHLDNSFEGPLTLFYLAGYVSISYISSSITSSSYTDMPKDAGRISQITSSLNSMLSGVPIETFVYQRQMNDQLASSNTYGKAMVMQEGPLLISR